MAIAQVIKILREIQILHEKKNQDYSAQDKPFENFDRSAQLISWFSNPRDVAYVSLIGTKLARLANLLSNNKTPSNESINDTFLDLATYCILWAASYDYDNFMKITYQEDKENAS